MGPDESAQDVNIHMYTHVHCTWVYMYITNMYFDICIHVDLDLSYILIMYKGGCR